MQVTKILKRDEQLETSNANSSNSDKIKIRELEETIKSLRIANNRLQSACDLLTKKANQLTDIMLIQKIIKERFHFVFILMNLFVNSSSLCLFGSLLKQMFEFVFHMDKISKQKHIGNPFKTELCFSFSNKTVVTEKEKNDNLFALLSLFDLLKTSHLSSGYIGKYKLKDSRVTKHSKDGSEYIPCAIFDFQSENEKMKVKVYTHLPIDYFDYNVNSFVLTSQSIYPAVFNQLNNVLIMMKNIMDLETQCLYDMEQKQNLAFPFHDVIPFMTKKQHLRVIYDTLSFKYLEIIDCGYTLASHGSLLPNISIEKKEECPITGCKAPYPVLKLVCNHTLSIMAYKGLISVQSHDSTESIKCPMCRKQCMIAFDIVKMITQEYVEFDPRVYNIFKTPKNKSENICDDAYEHLFDHI